MPFTVTSYYATGTAPLRVDFSSPLLKEQRPDGSIHVFEPNWTVHAAEIEAALWVHIPLPLYTALHAAMTQQLQAMGTLPSQE